jgi:pimeloyl-ACP methyl ester carboxylesterase
MQRMTVNGAGIAFADRGGDGEPLVLIHGGLVADAFRPLLAQPALAGYRTILYHRRGYGQSSRFTGSPGSLSTGQQAADCLALLRHLGIDGAHVAGYSYGGAVALQLALDAPRVVRSLALFEPTLPGAVTDPAALEVFTAALGASFQHYAAGQSAAAVDLFSRAAFGPEYAAHLDRALPAAQETAVRDADAIFAADLAALNQWRFTPAEASRISAPVLSVLHHDPHWVGFRQTDDVLRSWLPQTESVYLPAASHLLQILSPHDAAEALARVLVRNPLYAPVAQLHPRHQT